VARLVWKNPSDLTITDDIITDDDGGPSDSIKRQPLVEVPLELSRDNRSNTNLRNSIPRIRTVSEVKV
jgi:hypothetical protein